jgi:hypothetical protein
MTDKYTYIDEAKVWVCNDCGASASRKEEVNHHKSCIPGESEKWEKIYSKEGE